MKMLLSTAATAIILSTSAMADGHTSAISSYELQESDFFASDLIGMRVYATEDMIDTDIVAAGSETEWDDIGEINDLLVTADGRIEAAIVGVGGFLGMGEKDVALTMDQIDVKTEDGDMSSRFLVVNLSAEALEAAPAFESMTADEAHAMAEIGADADMADEMYDDRTMLTAPDVARDGFLTIESNQLTAEDLTGMRVYGANDEDVGEISEILMTDNGQVDRLVLDIGGFLGMGEHQIAVTPGELAFLREDGGELNVYIDATQEALEAQPAYEG